MKKAYIIITYTGTILSKIIKLYTRDEFSHVSISLDAELKQMYSFGRLNPYNPFCGGFVHEYIDKGTFKRFKNTRARILELEIEDSRYEKLKQIISDIEKNKKQYKFNVLGLFAIGFNKRIKKEKTFFCAEFVKYVIETSDIDIKLPELIRPDCFKAIKGNVVYTGLLREYNI